MAMPDNRNIPRPTSAFWTEGALRTAQPIRPFIRTGEERRSAEAAVAQMSGYLLRDLKQMESNGVPDEVLGRIEAMYLEKLALVEAQLEEYDRLRGGHAPVEMSLSELRPGLVRLRIARGMTQRELARALGVADSTVSRDERSLYEGLTIKKALRILEALGATAKVTLS